MSSNFRMSAKQNLIFSCAVVAQLVRALVCGTRGRRFNSYQPYHFISQKYIKMQAITFIKVLSLFGLSYKSVQSSHMLIA